MMNFSKLRQRQVHKPPCHALKNKGWPEVLRSREVKQAGLARNQPIKPCNQPITTLIGLKGGYGLSPRSRHAESEPTRTHFLVEPAQNRYKTGLDCQNPRN